MFCTVSSEKLDIPTENIVAPLSLKGCSGLESRNWKINSNCALPPSILFSPTLLEDTQWTQTPAKSGTPWHVIDFSKDEELVQRRDF